MNTTAQREDLSALLEKLNLSIATVRLYLDLLIDLDSWRWMDGSPIDAALWKSGFPREEKGKTCVVLDLDGRKPAIKNVPCIINSVTGFICQSREGEKSMFLLLNIDPSFH